MLLVLRNLEESTVPVLTCPGHTPRRSGGYRIGYWATDSGTAEVDFVVQAGNRIIPIEVKATVNLKARSLASFRKQFAPRQSVRFSLADYEENHGLYNIPLYLLEAAGQLLAEPSSVARK